MADGNSSALLSKVSVRDVIVPCYANDGDVLCLQYVAIELDLGLVQVVGPSGRALLDYVAAERTRVAAGPSQIGSGEIS